MPRSDADNPYLERPDFRVKCRAIGRTFPLPRLVVSIEVPLIDEFKIRKQVAGIAASSEPPLRKARLILRLARRVRAAAHALGGHSHRSFREGDTLRAARMREATDRLIETHAEIRAHAGAALAAPDRSADAPSAHSPAVP